MTTEVIPDFKLRLVLRTKDARMKKSYQSDGVT